MLCHCMKPGHYAKNCRQAPICYNCGKSGHMSKACRMPQRMPRTSKTHFSNETRDKEYKGFSYFSCPAASEQCNEQEILIDSGCKNFMIKDRDFFVSVDETSKGIVSCANNTESIIEGRGDVQFYAEDTNGEKKIIELKNALYVPDYSRNLVSVKRLTEMNMQAIFDKDSARIVTGDNKEFKLQCKNNLYLWKCETRLGIEANSSKETLETWHQRLGHNNKCDVLKLQGIAEGMNITNLNDTQC